MRCWCENKEISWRLILPLHYTREQCPLSLPDDST